MGTPLDGVARDEAGDGAGAPVDVVVRPGGEEAKTRRTGGGKKDTTQRSARLNRGKMKKGKPGRNNRT